MRHAIAVALAVGVAAVVGCGDDGPKRYKVSGSVTFDGQPIPYGDIVFTPDGSKKNSGPQGFAKIRDGRSETDADKGIGGGPTVLHVTAFRGPDGKGLMCEMDLPADLPH